jgi:hypothetical protein
MAAPPPGCWEPSSPGSRRRPLRCSSLPPANRVEGLPPELLRKGRFDEIFFIDLPDVGEREEILRIHLDPARAASRRALTSWRLPPAPSSQWRRAGQAVVEGLHFRLRCPDRARRRPPRPRPSPESVPLAVTLRGEISRIRGVGARKIARGPPRVGLRGVKFLSRFQRLERSRRAGEGASRTTGERFRAIEPATAIPGDPRGPHRRPRAVRPRGRGSPGAPAAIGRADRSFDARPAASTRASALAAARAATALDTLEAVALQHRALGPAPRGNERSTRRSSSARARRIWTRCAASSWSDGPLASRSRGDCPSARASAPGNASRGG